MYALVSPFPDFSSFSPLDFAHSFELKSAKSFQVQLQTTIFMIILELLPARRTMENEMMTVAAMVAEKEGEMQVQIVLRFAHT